MFETIATHFVITCFNLNLPKKKQKKKKKKKKMCDYDCKTIRLNLIDALTKLTEILSASLMTLMFFPGFTSL